jgi:hypothetical protein
LTLVETSKRVMSMCIHQVVVRFCMVNADVSIRGQQ